MTDKHAMIAKFTSLIKRVMYLDSEIRVELSDDTQLAFWLHKDGSLHLDVWKGDKKDWVLFNEHEDGWDDVLSWLDFSSREELEEVKS